MTSQALYETLGKEIYACYTKNTFAKLLKSEIDIIVFHYFILKNLPSEKIDQEVICYELINKEDIYNLSLKSGLTESLIQSKIELDFYNYRSKENESFDLKAFIKKQLESSKKGFDDVFKDGKIRLLVANPVVKKQVVNALACNGNIPDYSFNRDIISIGIYDIFDILGINNDSLNKNLLSAIQEYAQSKNVTEEEKQKINKIEGKSAKEICKSIIMNVGLPIFTEIATSVLKNMLGINK